MGNATSSSPPPVPPRPKPPVEVVPEEERSKIECERGLSTYKGRDVNTDFELFNEELHDIGESYRDNSHTVHYERRFYDTTKKPWSPKTCGESASEPNTSIASAVDQSSQTRLSNAASAPPWDYPPSGPPSGPPSAPPSGPPSAPPIDYLPLYPPSYPTATPITIGQVPVDLLRQSVYISEQVNAYMGTQGNPAVMRSFVQPPSYLTLGLITVGLLAVAYVILLISNYYEIKQNWAEYRCMPSVAPFASFYGYNLSENMNFCISQSVKEHSPGVIDPIYAGINKVTGVVDGVFDKVASIESGVGSLLSGFQSFIVNFVNSFNLLGTRVRMSLIRIKDIFARIYGLFIAFAYAGISAITFGENLVCNPLVVFLGTITGVDICCFAPDTLIAMADGSRQPIAAIRMGDVLAGGSEVTSTYLFEGKETPMVSIDGIHVSGNHYLVGPSGSMIQAAAHPSAVSVASLDRLWCLGTSDNRIPIVNNKGRVMTFADYEESEEDDVVAAAQAISERTLNGPHGEKGPTVSDYSLGLDPTFQVHLRNGSWVPLRLVKIGDALMGGGTVIGLIEEVCDLQCRTPAGHRVSAAQLVLYEGKWVRAAHIFKTVESKQSILSHLMVTNNASIIVGGDGEVLQVRDYAEVTSLDIQAPYDEKMKGVGRA